MKKKNPVLVNYEKLYARSCVLVRHWFEHPSFILRVSLAAGGGIIFFFIGQLYVTQAAVSKSNWTNGQLVYTNSGFCCTRLWLVLLLTNPGHFYLAAISLN